MDGEGTGQISVHGARGEVDKVPRSRKYSGWCNFLWWVQVTDLELRIKNSRLDGACGLGALPLAAHMNFVGGSREREMVADDAQQKPGIVTNSLLCSSVRSNVLAGGEQRAWWINRVYSAVVEVPVKNYNGAQTCYL